MNGQDKLAQMILEAAHERGLFKSTCPSEIAREMFPEDWRKHMGEIRDAAIRLHKSGQVLLMQKGRIIDPDDFKGPIRIRIGRKHIA